MKIPIEFVSTEQRVIPIKIRNRRPPGFSWSVGIVCQRDLIECASYEYDQKCWGGSCPFKQGG